MALSGAALTPAEIQKLLAGPAGPPPPGATVEFKDPSDQSPWVYFTFAICLTAATLAVVMRLFTRWRLIKSFVLEDYVIIAAWGLQIAEFTSAIVSNSHGAGKHMWNIHLSDFIHLQYYINISAIMYGPAVGTVKVAILLQILRIFAPVYQLNKRLFIGGWTTIIVIILFYVTTTFTTAFQCIPHEKIWNPFVQGGHCLNSPAMYKGTGLFNVISDFAILLLPLPDIYQLHVPLRRKALIMTVFATGIFACITSILRTYYTFQTYGSTDPTYIIQTECLWTWAEMATGIIIFCLPVAPKFCNYVKETVSSHSSQRGLGPNATQRSDDEQAFSEDQHYRNGKGLSPHSIELASVTTSNQSHRQGSSSSLHNPHSFYDVTDVEKDPVTTSYK